MLEKIEVPCKMVVAMSIGDMCNRIGCVVSYDGNTRYGIKETLDEYAGYVDDLFHSGASIPLEPGIYNFDGFAIISMMGGSDEPVIFDGVFSRYVKTQCAQTSNLNLNHNILKWIATGEVGLSSKAMALAAVGIQSDCIDHPLDPSDFHKCLLLLEAVPEVRNHIDKIAELSNEWKKLIKNWNEIESCFLAEAGLNWEHKKVAIETFRLMRSLGC